MRADLASFKITNAGHLRLLSLAGRSPRHTARAARTLARGQSIVEQDVAIGDRTGRCPPFRSPTAGRPGGVAKDEHPTSATS